MTDLVFKKFCVSNFFLNDTNTILIIKLRSVWYNYLVNKETGSAYVIILCGFFKHFPGKRMTISP